jgi:hypothetical protein
VVASSHHRFPALDLRAPVDGARLAGQPGGEAGGNQTDGKNARNQGKPGSMPIMITRYSSIIGLTLLIKFELCVLEANN